MERQKIHREYLLNATSKSILWSAISTPTGLEGWFADRVQSDDKIVTFFWGKTEHRDAEIIAVRAFSFIRFRWLDDEYEREYFELKMTNNERFVRVMGLSGRYSAENVRFLVNFDIKIFHTPFFMLILCLHCMKRVKCCA